MTSIKNPVAAAQTVINTLSGAATTLGTPVPAPTAPVNTQISRRALTTAALTDYSYSANQSGRYITQTWVNDETSTFNWTINPQTSETFNTTDGGAALASITLQPGESRTFVNSTTTTWTQI